MKRSGLSAIDEVSLARLVFLFNYNGLRGFHQNSIHLETSVSETCGRTPRSMCYRDDVSMTLMFRPQLPSRRERPAREHGKRVDFGQVSCRLLEDCVAQQFGRQRPGHRPAQPQRLAVQQLDRLPRRGI